MTNLEARARHGWFLMWAALVVTASGCSYLQSPSSNGKIAVQVVSGDLVKKLAEPDAGLSNQKISVLNSSDHVVVASKTTDSSGLVEFDVPQGSYILIGASNEPENVRVEAGQTLNLKFVRH